MGTKEKIIDIFNESFKEFAKDMHQLFYNVEKTQKDDNQIAITYKTRIEDDVLFTIYMKKQNKEYDTIPKLKGVKELVKEGNPYLLKNNNGQMDRFTDETFILSKIYEKINQTEYKEIALYEDYGILVLNPGELKGLYNINIKIKEETNVKRN